MSTTITGNLVDKPTLRFTNSGLPVASFSVAVSSKKGEEEYTSYFDCSAWGSLAENLSASLEKGARVFVEGNLTQDRFEKDGVKREKVVLTANNAGPDLRWATAVVTKTAPSGAKKEQESDF